MKTSFPEFAAAASCKHPNRLRLLANYEMACDECVHVAIRKDGKRAVYAAPREFGGGTNPIRLAASLIETTGVELDEEQIEKAAALVETPVTIVNAATGVEYDVETLGVKMDGSIEVVGTPKPGDV